MKRFALPLLVVSSILVASVGRIDAATRPRYGGTLHISLMEAPASLDPVDPASRNSASIQGVERLLFDNLVALDEAGRLRPAIARSWQSDDSSRRWTFTLRSGVTFADGTLLTAELAAASLRSSNPEWSVSFQADAVVIQLEKPEWKLPARLALTRNAIAKRSNGTAIGTGAYQVSEWQPGKHLGLTAREDYWGGRPYIDSMKIEFGAKARDQLAAIELGKFEVADVSIEATQPATAKGRVSGSGPVELFAIVLRRELIVPRDSDLMNALSASIDRTSIKDVLLRGRGEVAGGVLPQWISGYEFLFPSSTDHQRASQLRRQVKQDQPWSLGYDLQDPLNQMIAERIALNAKDVGIALQPVAGMKADLQLTRLYVLSTDPRVALEEIYRGLGLPANAFIDPSIAAVYQAELVLLKSHRVLPLVHMPVEYAISPVVRNWRMQPDGSWDGTSLWLLTGMP